MVQYIDKAALAAEIKRRIENCAKQREDMLNVQCYTLADDASARIGELNCIQDFIDTLEVKEVDLDGEMEKEYERFLDEVEGLSRMWHSDEQIEWAKNIAKHFFELGVRTTHPITANDIGIEAHIISLLDEWKFCSSTEAKYRCEAYSELLEWIYTRLKEPAFGNPEEVAKHFSEHCINQTQKEKQ